MAESEDRVVAFAPAGYDQSASGQLNFGLAYNKVLTTSLMLLLINLGILISEGITGPA